MSAIDKSPGDLCFRDDLQDIALCISLHHISSAFHALFHEDVYEEMVFSADQAQFGHFYGAKESCNVILSGAAAVKSQR